MISASAVKELRAISGAGMMDCKKALVAADGDVKLALENLRKSGIAKAQKKSGRSTREGAVTQYIHPGSKLGVLVEINCETDFVARTDGFKQFCKDIAMHIAAIAPLVVSRDDMEKSIIEKEIEILSDQARQSGKPEHVIEKMITGRMEKFYSETVLLEQTFVKDQDKTVKELLTDMIATLGENITIARFVRFQLGETQVADSTNS